jgi:hypothetical protein
VRKDLTNVDWFNPDTLLDMSCRRVIGDFMGQDFGLAESINEGGPSSSGGTCRGELELKAPKLNIQQRTDYHEGELNTLFDLVSSAPSCERHCDDSWGEV